MTATLDGIPDLCLDLVAQHLVNKDSTIDLINFALSGPRNYNAASRVTTGEHNQLPVHRFHYHHINRKHRTFNYPYKFAIVSTRFNHEFDSIQDLACYDDKRMNTRTMTFPNRRYDKKKRLRIMKSIPSIKEIRAHVFSAKDIYQLSSLLGDIYIDTFYIMTGQFDEALKVSVLDFYKNRRGRVLDISSSVLLHVHNFEESVMLFLAHVDVTFRLRNVVNGIYRGRWYTMFAAVMARGGKITVDGEAFPNENLEWHRAHVIKFELPRK